MSLFYKLEKVSNLKATSPVIFCGLSNGTLFFPLVTVNWAVTMGNVTSENSNWRASHSRLEDVIFHVEYFTSQLYVNRQRTLSIWSGCKKAGEIAHQNMAKNLKWDSRMLLKVWNESETLKCGSKCEMRLENVVQSVKWECKMWLKVWNETPKSGNLWNEALKCGTNLKCNFCMRHKVRNGTLKCGTKCEMRFENVAKTSEMRLTCGLKCEMRL